MRRNVKNPQKLAKGTIITRVRTLKAVLQEAVKMGYMEKNPMTLVPSTYHIKPIRNERYALTEEELAILQASRCHTPELKDAFMFCCLTGLRKSDALSLRPADIQEYDGTYYIHTQHRHHPTLYPRNNPERRNSPAPVRQKAAPMLYTQHAALLTELP